jgi:hypothetical protein
LVSRRLLPQLKQFGKAEILDSFAGHLHSSSPKLAQSPEDKAAVQSLLGEFLTSQLEQLNFFAVTVAPARPMGYVYYPQPSKLPEGSPNIVFSFIKKCIDYANPDICVSVIERMLNEISKLPTPEAESRGEDVLLPLIPLIHGDPVVKVNVPESLLRRLGMVAIESTMSAIQNRGGKVESKHVDVLLSAATQSGNVDLVRAL